MILCVRSSKKGIEMEIRLKKKNKNPTSFGDLGGLINDRSTLGNAVGSF